ncbi:MAG TPA: YfhO family protein [Candidatus Kapabacteria bacterium]|nr:YfhO family protein [Candidatus Kapabacteria bacterium]
MKKNSIKTTKLNLESQLEIKSLPHYLPIIIFAITTIVFFGGQINSNTFFWEDFAEYVYPTQTFAARESAGGVIPFWNPYIFSGMPFIADLQTGFFYPFNRLLNFFVDSSGHLSVWGLQFITIIHFFIAQLSFYFLIIYYKRSQLSAIFTAIAFAFSGILVMHVIHPMMVYHLAWFPLVLLFFDKGIKERNFRKGIVAGLILGMSLLSGHPQTSLYLFTFLFVYYVWIVLTDYIDNKATFKEIAFAKLPAILTFLVAIGIFAVQYLPSRELANEAVRNESTYEKSAEGSLEFSQIVSSVIPNAFGVIIPEQNNKFPFYLMSGDKQAPYYYYWETSFYFGVPILILGLFGFITGFRDRRLQVLLFLVVFAFLYALGSNFVLHKVFYNFPFFKLFRMPARMMMYLVIIFPIAASFGFDYLLNNSKQLQNIVIASILPIIIALLGVSGLLSGMIETPASLTSILSSNSLLALLFATITFAVMYLITNRKINYLSAGGILVVIIFADLYLAHSEFNSSKTNFKDSYTMGADMVQSFRSTNLDNMFRVNTRSYNPPYMATNRNQGMIDAFQNTEGYNPLVLARVNPALKNSEEIYDLLNVKYELRVDKEKGQPYFYENSNRLPRAWMVYNYRVIPADKIKEEMPKQQINYFNEVILEEEPKLNKTTSIDTTFEPNVAIREYKNNYIRLEVLNTEKDGILVLSEIWYPAWQVSIDGIPAKLYRANYSLRGVAIPKGKSKIEFRFTSQQFAYGQWIAIFTLIIALPLLFIGKFRRKENNEE